jgi:nucleotide-binding universal stress UspA family protein
VFSVRGSGIVIAASSLVDAATGAKVEAAMRVERILLPTDFSDESQTALNYASQLAATFGAVLHIVHVDDLNALVAKSAYCYPSFVAAAERTHIKSQLECVRPTDPSVRYVHHFIEGDPATQICALADCEDVDLVVMSSHGRTGISRFVMGSVAERVLRRAKTPVLVVKPGRWVSTAARQSPAMAEAV